MTTQFTLLRQFDAAPYQTAEGTPAGASSALLLWDASPEPPDGGVAAPVAAALATALVRIGDVVFRWSGPPAWDEGLATVTPPPRRGLAALPGLRGAAPAGAVISTGAASVARHLFDWDFEQQGQAALVIARGADAAEATLKQVATTRDWRAFRFAPGMRLLLTPAVDGIGALLCAPDAPLLEEAVADIGRAAREAGFAMSVQ